MANRKVRHGYAASDARIFEVPCPACGVLSEITWDAITWDEGKPETARWRCPECHDEIAESHKPAMVAAGVWRATRPEVNCHAGFCLNALVSLHTNASWAKLAAEFVTAKDDPRTLQTFINTILGQGWKGDGDELDEDALVARAEGWGLDAVPGDVLALTRAAKGALAAGLTVGRIAVYPHTGRIVIFTKGAEGSAPKPWDEVLP